VAQHNLREQLVEAGSRVLFEKGFHASSINDIVEAAGVPKGSFYNHFESKEALALEVARRYAESYDTTGLRHGDGSPLARVRAHFRSIADRTIARGVSLGCLLGNFSTELPGHSTAIRTYVSAALTHWGNEVAACLKEAQTAGELAGTVDTHALGHYLVDAYEEHGRARKGESRPCSAGWVHQDDLRRDGPLARISAATDGRETLTPLRRSDALASVLPFRALSDGACTSSAGASVAGSAASSGLRRERSRGGAAHHVSPPPLRRRSVQTGFGRLTIHCTPKRSTHIPK
jgi:TetR/AcrR family transcriptional repressor of nem operon